MSGQDPHPAGAEADDDATIGRGRAGESAKPKAQGGDPDPEDATTPLRRVARPGHAAGASPGRDAPSPKASPAHGDAAFEHPEHIGPFRIVRLLGEGGMGAVYLAEQDQPVRRQVALKLMHASLRSPLALARFTAERQAMARLSHPNVAQLHEAGTTNDGFPYFAMEYLPGKPFIEYCNTQRLDLRARVALFVSICHGVLHAHQKGLVHRDLKPSNVLVAEIDGHAVPKVIDFGIAKAIDQPLTEDADLTGARAIGTPSYMSPEALLGNADIDTRTDVYALGVVLYALLCGVRPHEMSGAALATFMATGQRPDTVRPSARVPALEPALAQQVGEQRRLAPRQLAQALRGELDWIVMKSIADDRERRYGSVAELASDLNRYLNHEPVEARPPSFGYRAGKLVRRHRFGFAAAATVLVALVLGIVGTTVGMMRAAREAEAARQVSGFLTRMFQVPDPGVARGSSVTAREVLDLGARRIRTELSNQPLISARLMHTMGLVYQNLGLYEDAAPLEQEALEVRRKALGPDHPDVGVSLNALGTLRNKEGRYAEAERLQREAVAVLAKTLGPDSPELAEAQMQLGLTCFLLDRHEEAESLLRRALAVRESALGPDHPDVAENLAHLGYLLGNDGRYAEAETYLSRALAIRTATLGEDHFMVAVSKDLLADAYAGEGRYPEAEALYLGSLALKEKVYTATHPEIAESLFALGRLYAAQGKGEEAEARLRAGIAIVEKTLGADHISLSRGLQELGLLFGNQGRWAESEDVFRRLVRVYEVAVGPEHRWVGEALNNLGTVLADGLHRYPEAETVLRRAVAIFPDEPGADFSGALARWSLANCLRDQQRYLEAQAVYAEALTILDRGGGPKRVEYPQLPAFLADYAKSLRDGGQEVQAIAIEVRLPTSDR